MILIFLNFLFIFFFTNVSALASNSTSLILGRPFKANIASIFIRQKNLTMYYEIVKPAVDLAVEECNKKYKDFFEINVYNRNDSDYCFNTISPFLASEEYYLHNTIALIGPSCLYSLNMVGRLASFWNIPLLTSGGSSIEFNDKSLFSTMTRLSYSLDRISDFIIQTFKEFEWKHIAFFVDENDLSSLSLEKTLKELMKEEQSLTGYTFNYITMSFNSGYNSTKNFEKMLLEASYESRVFIFLVEGKILRSILLKAYDLNFHLKNEYTFATVELIKSKKVDSIEWYIYGDKRNKEAKTMFESLLIFTIKIPMTDAYKNFVYEISKRARNEFKKDFTIEDVNQNVAAIYDAILIYCLALNETLEDGDNPYDGKQLLKRIWGRSFINIGITGEILINSNGDRETDYTLDDLDPETGQFRSVYNYFGKTRKIEKVPDVNIIWPNKNEKSPLDIPFCGFRNEKQECNQSITWSTIFIIIISVLIILSGVGFSVYKLLVKMKYESKLTDNWWKIHWEDIQFADRANAKNRSSLSMNKSESSFKTTNTGKTSHTTKTSALSSMATTLANVDSSILCGHYKGIRVAVKPLNVPKLNITRENLIEFKQMSEIIHSNLVKFIGICVEDTVTATVTELSVRGSLKDMLENEKISIDWMFKCSMINDIIEGMFYLHSSPIEYHGHLKSSNLVVDSRFNVSICDYGLRSIYLQVKSNEEDYNPRQLYWTAPEHLRDKLPLKSGSKKGDIYSFAIILQEIITRQGPWENLPENQRHILQNPEELLDRVKAGVLPPFRPEIYPEDCEAPEIIPILNLCWGESPNIRPEFVELKQKFKKITRGITSSKLLDNLMKRVETYSSNLESIVKNKTEDIIIEKERAEELLNNLLPSFIVEQLKNNIPVLPETFPSVTIMFSDVSGFQQLSKTSNPQQIVNMLNDIYDLLDGLLANHDVYKLESINDAYLVASGVPVKNGQEHVREIAYCAIEAREAIDKFKARHDPSFNFKLRVGIHSGSCVAGVIGLKMPKYCLFGDTINTASRMSTNSEPGKIQISSKTKELLDIFGNFVILPRGEVQIKGKGAMKTFWLDSLSNKREVKKIKSRASTKQPSTESNLLKEKPNENITKT